MHINAKHCFTTERLLIRPLIEQDRDLYFSLYCNEKIMRHIGKAFSQQEAENAFTRTLKAMQKEKPPVITWAIVTLDNNECIGIQALNWQTSKLMHKPNTANINQAEIGIMLTAESQGQRFPEESMTALIDYAFNALGLDKINAFYAKKNLKSKRVFDKLGFIFDTEQKQQQPENTNDSYQYVDKVSIKKSDCKT